MVAVKSLETLLLELKTFLRAYSRRLDSGDNSISRELILTPYAVGGKLVMDQVALSRDLHIVSRLSGTDLDNEATNYKLERSLGTYATVSLYFYTNNAPTSDVIVPAGTRVQTIGTSFASPVLFTTISDTTFSFVDASNYYSFDRTRYEFPVSAVCSVVGISGNVAANTLISLLGSISGISGVTNIYASSGGEGAESDEDLRTRIKLAATGRDLNVPNGIRSAVRAMGFSDAYMIRIEDSEAERSDGVDVFVIDKTPESYEETFSYDSAQSMYAFTKRPVVEVTSVKDGNGNVISATDYDVHLDSSTSLRRSVYAQDYISVFPSAGLTTGDLFTVIYTYSSGVVQAQQYFESVDNRVLTSNILIKRSFPLELFVTAALTLKASSDGPSTRTQIQNAVSQWTSSFNLDENLQKSDLVIVLQEGFGDFPVDTVDAVVISDYYLQDEFGNVFSPVGETISVDSKYYVVYGNTVLS
jgi:hypothetical protein